MTWRWDRIALSGAIAALIARFVWAGDAAWTYNEATYTELARHPWFSSFYPDTVFVRHPPIAFGILAGWIGVLGDVEWIARWPALVALIGGTWFVWDAVRRQAGMWPAALAAVVLGASYPLHAYGLQVSMYPFAFLFATIAVWCRQQDRWRAEGAWLAALALTHLFGFVFLAFWALDNRRELRTVAAIVALPGLWLVASTIIGFVFNADTQVLALGPAGQAARGIDTETPDLAATAWIHVITGLFVWWTLNPVLAAAAPDKTARGRSWPWLVAVAIIALYIIPGPPYLRYAIVPLPFLVYLGATALARLDVARARRVGVAAAVTALTTIPAGFAFVQTDIDPRAAGDLPGLQDWQAAFDLLPAGVSHIATSGPTATAMYHLDAGWRVVDRSGAPFLIGLAVDGAEPTRWIERIDRVEDLEGLESTGVDAWIIPGHWGAEEHRRGIPECGSVDGLVVWSLRCGRTT